MQTVLIVDDEPSVRRALRRLLENAGMAVEESASASAALKLLGPQRGIDAVVCDVLMPEMNGLEFYDLLLTRAPHLRDRTVFLTGLAHDPNVHDPIEQRGVPLVSKLDDLLLVVDAVRVALLRSGQPDP